MSIERVGTNAHTQIIFAQLRQASSALVDSERQVATGKVASDYSGFGARSGALEAARSAAKRADAHKAVADRALGRLDLQDLNITRLGDMAAELRQAMTETLASNDGEAFMTLVRNVFDRAAETLNARDPSGFIFAGERDDTAAMKVSSLDALAALPAVGDAFANGSIKRAVRVGDGETIEIGALASDLGTELMSLLRDIALFDQGNAFGGNLSAAQVSFLESKLPEAISVAEHLNVAAAANGLKYQQVKAASERQSAASVVFKGFVSDIEDVDIGEALSRLNQNQVMLQAALHVTSTLNRLSLLDFLAP